MLLFIVYRLCIDHLKEFESMMGKDLATNSSKGRQGVGDRGGFVGQSEKASSVKSGRKKKAPSSNLDPTIPVGISISNPPSIITSNNPTSTNATSVSGSSTGPNLNITTAPITSAASITGTIGTTSDSPGISPNSTAGTTCTTSSGESGRLSFSKERIGLHSSIAELNENEERVVSNL